MPTTRGLRPAPSSSVVVTWKVVAEMLSRRRRTVSAGRRSEGIRFECGGGAFRRRKLRKQMLDSLLRRRCQVQRCDSVG